MAAALRLRDGAGTRPCASFAAAGAPGPWLIVVPHDDDLVLGMGLTVQAARAEGIEVHVAVVSDGRSGYAAPAARAGIVERRRQEMLASAALLGLAADAVHWCGFPDADLPSWRGRRELADGTVTGIAHALTRVLRATRPGTVFGPTAADLHPDHVTVAQELAIACFHASGRIWLELGDPVALPARWDYAVYCAFPGAPELQVLAPEPLLARKLAAIRAFASQEQIGALVATQERAGAQEYFQRATWQPYDPQQYRGLFPGSATGEAAPAGGASAGAPAGTGAGDGFAADCALVDQLLASWSADPWPELATALRESPRRPLLLVGEGSSRLFPAAVASALAAQAPGRLTLRQVGGREAATLPLDQYRVLLISNSGRTRELIDLLPALPATPPALALVGVPGGALAERVAATRVLLPVPERAVAATASVFAQALTLAHACAAVAALPVPWDALRRGVAQAQRVTWPTGLRTPARVWWSGDEAGPAGELALKTMETAGLLGVHLPGSLVLHGIEEVLTPEDLVIAFRPDARDLPALVRRIGATGAQLLAIGAVEAVAAAAAAAGPGSTVSTLALPACGPWTGFLELVGGWRLLAGLSARCGRDPDRPRRARKVGNPMPAAGAAGA